MITLKNVDKYFNKRKKNEIHVINNISLDLEDTGLVSILGPSGCGKTTLLNSIGGLDKVNKGQIFINNQKINSKCSYKVDKIRNLNIGYIFQDYKLIENLSVYENLALVLKMVGIKNKDEVKQRIDYVLDKVGMLRYKRRPAGMLSGGEKQRVGIARALVKNPDIILADEPTGNLDSKNSLAIMRIIKAISKEKLVILVTHEQDLAKFYASRIIELKDGEIVKDYTNNSDKELDYKMDNNFYLKDFKYINKLNKDDLNINVYSDNKDKIKLDIVVKNGNIYIKSNTKDKLEIVEDKSSIEFIDDNYKKINIKEEKNLSFDFDNIKNNKKLKYSSILNMFSLITKGFKNVFGYSVLKKILLGGFVLSGMFIMYSVASIFASFDIRDEDFVTINKNYLVISQKKVKVDDYLKYEKDETVSYLLPGDSLVGFDYSIDKYYQTHFFKANLSGSISDINLITEKDLMVGKMPENNNEIVVDKLAIKKMLTDNQTKMAGITEINQLLNEIVIQKDENYKIVGITDLGSPSIYISKDKMIDVIYNTSEDVYEYIEEEMYNIVNYEKVKDKITLKKGKYPTNDYEVLIGYEYKDEIALNKTIDVKVNNKKLKVVGYYESKYGTTDYLVNENTIKYKLITSKENIIVYSENINDALDSFKQKNINIQNSYDYDKEEYKKSIRENNRSTVIASSIMLGISLIEMFLISRSSFLSRIKEIGILRGIGVKKSDIYKMFSGEIIAINTLASVPGILFMAYILNTIASVNLLERMFMINIFTILVSIIIVYVFNLVIGLIPVFNLVRKTPAQILSRHDLE